MTFFGELSPKMSNSVVGTLLPPLVYYCGLLTKRGIAHPTVAYEYKVAS
jgi:hypothetical protein